MSLPRWAELFPRIAGTSWPPRRMARDESGAAKMANACVFSVVIRSGVSEDGVDLYLCLDGMAWDIFFLETNITNRWASRFPRVVFLACVLSRKRSSVYFLGGTFWSSFWSCGTSLAAQIRPRKLARNIMNPEAFPIWKRELSYLPKPRFVGWLLDFQGEKIHNAVQMSKWSFEKGYGCLRLAWFRASAIFE